MAAEADSSPPKAIEQLLQEHRQQLQERIKELNCLYSISELAGNPDLSLAEILQGVVDRIPAGWQIPEITCARLVLEGREFKSANFRDFCWKSTVPVTADHQAIGFLEVGFSEDRPWGAAGPFLEEEKRLLGEVAERIGKIVWRKKTEEALLESEKRFRALFEQAAVGVAQIATASGRFVRINRRYCEIVGYSAEEMETLTFQAITHPQDLEADRTNIRRLIAGEIEAFSLEKRYFHKDGKIIWVDLTVSPMWAKGEPPGYHIAVVQDITERKRFEERIRGLSQQLLRGQEDERRRISRELHDVIGQNLSALKVALDTQALNKPEEASEVNTRILEWSRLLQETIAGLRDMAHTLRPSGLERLGLIKAVLQFCEEFSRKSGIQVDFFSAGVKDAALGGEVRIALYRLIQEGLLNIQKHAAAERASIRLVSSHPNLILRIEDDGRGFDVQKRREAATQEKRLGLSSMEERVSLLGGVMKIDSQPGQGTRIYIEVPAQSSDSED
jgi:PAS domain S-box-containing protein